MGPAILEAKQEGSGQLGEGTRVRQVASFLGKKLDATFEITEWEANRRFTVKSATGPFPLEQSSTFTRHDDLTRLDVRIEGETEGFFKLADSLVANMGRRQFAADYANLKDLLESGVAASTGEPKAQV